MSHTNSNKLTPQKKLAELIKACIKYGADKDGKITKTKLAKLVYLADFAFYYNNLIPITGVTYKKLDNGPVSIEFFNELLGLVGTHEVSMQKKGNVQLLSLADIKTDVSLEKKELELTENVCKKWQNKKTDEIVKFTHEQLPWKISFDNDVVPYSLIIQQDEAKLY
jgi:uncharacterized phage-associated protein